MIEATEQSYQVVLFPWRYLSPSTLWFQGWGKDAGRDTHQYDPSVGHAANRLLRLPWLLFLGPQADTSVYPMQSLVFPIS